MGQSLQSILKQEKMEFLEGILQPAVNKFLGWPVECRDRRIDLSLAIAFTASLSFHIGEYKYIRISQNSLFYYFG